MMTRTTLTRRLLLKTILLGGPALLAAPLLAQTPPALSPFVSRRPPLADRKFVSPAIENFIQSVQSRIADPEVAWMFGNCFPNTLDTAVHFHDGAVPDTFVLTGDIPAMWLRDTTAELWPYLPLTKQDPRLKRLFSGAIRRQTACILLDPYANAFLEDPGKTSQWVTDDTVMKPGVHERKWEVDSLCFPVRLAYGYWKTTRDTSPFDADWEQAMDLIVQTLKEQQRKDSHGPYYFRRGAPKKLDLSQASSYGMPVKPNGLIYSAFRPSDDPTTFPFLIPSNFFAVVALRQMAEMRYAIRGGSLKVYAALALADEVEAALIKHAVQKNAEGDFVYAYETDGLGNFLFLDDPNVPGLLSLPYLGACAPDDPVYAATRRFVWSSADRSFASGRYAGLGSPHTAPGSIWPIGLCVWGLTSADPAEIAGALAELKATHAGTGFMHESFDKDNPNHYTRSWFAWANSLFGEFVVYALNTHPQVLARPLPPA